MRLVSALAGGLTALAEDQRSQVVHRHRTLGLLCACSCPPGSRTVTGPSRSCSIPTNRTLVRFVFADADFAGRLLDWATTLLRNILSTMRRPASQRGFAVIPRRWAVERILAWLTAHRPGRDYERHPTHARATIRCGRPTTEARLHGLKPIFENTLRVAQPLITRHLIRSRTTKSRS